jgi:hypothetical protein
MYPRLLLGLIGLPIALVVMLIIGIVKGNIDFQEIIKNTFVQKLFYALLIGALLFAIKTCSDLIK